MLKICTITDMESADISGILSENISKTKISLQRTVRTRPLETCMGYQPRSNIGKDGHGNLLPYFCNIVNMWKNPFPQLLKVHCVSDVRQIEIHTAGTISSSSKSS
jgi:hypothetical protein